MAEVMPHPAQRVLLAVGLVPEGRVASYGDIGALVGVGPRQVGAVLREHGGTVPWWRIVGHDGATALGERARERWDAEGIGQRPDGRCRLREHRVDRAQLADDYRFALAERGWPILLED